MIVNYRSIESKVVELLGAAGVPDEAAAVVTDHVLANEILGRTSLGLFRLPGIVAAAEAAQSMEPDIRINAAQAGTWIVDGGELPGIYVLWRATNELIALQQAVGGVTALGVRNYLGTTGSIGLFAWQAAQAGIPAVVTCNSARAIAAPGGTNPIVGTNPVAFAFPGDDGEIVVGDYASSVWSYGDIAIAGLRGQELPGGVVLDSSGHPATDPGEADNGSMVPSGGHKGFCQSLMVELLCGALVGGKVAAEEIGRPAALLIAFSPDAFGHGDDMNSRVTLASQHISTSRPGPGAQPRVPGAGYQRLLREQPIDLEIDDLVVTRLKAAGVEI